MLAGDAASQHRFCHRERKRDLGSSGLHGEEGIKAFEELESKHGPVVKGPCARQVAEEDISFSECPPTGKSGLELESKARRSISGVREAMSFYRPATYFRTLLRIGKSTERI